MDRPRRSKRLPARFMLPADSESDSTSQAPSSPRGSPTLPQQLPLPAVGAANAAVRVAEHPPSSSRGTSTTATATTAASSATRGRGKAKAKRSLSLPKTTSAKRKPRKVGKGQAFAQEELEAATHNVQDRQQHLEDVVNEMDLETMRRVLINIGHENPGLVLDLLENAPQQEGPLPPPPADSPAWCRCHRCRLMPSAVEDICCGQRPTDCVSQTPEMRLLCLDRHVLRLSMLYRADILGMGNINMEDMRLKHQSLRYSGYRQYTLWQHGRLGRGNRRVIPSCCIWRIRDEYPDPSGQYVPYRPGAN